MKIRSVGAHQIYDSRGNPTIEAEIELENGVRGRGLVPSGASTGQFEAIELRDADPRRWRGKSVLKAIENIHREIAPAIVGRPAGSQRELDDALIALDGTPGKRRLGANAILAVSMAAADAAAKAAGIALFEHLGGSQGNTLPLPQIQIVGGGAHAAGRLDVQDYMVIATGAKSYAEALEMTFNIFHAAGDLLRERGLLRGCADEGGYWPEFETNEEPMALLVEAIGRSGYTPGREASLALDIAASELFCEATKRYALPREGRDFSSGEFADLIASWCGRFPIVSIEDPMADTDWDGWRRVAGELGPGLQLVGDDLFTTNLSRIEEGFARGAANAVLIKPNQIGTVSETLDAIRLTQKMGWKPIVSARSGETEDAFIAHLAVATNAGQLKVGSLARGERTAKWNEVLRIARILGPQAKFSTGKTLFPRDRPSVNPPDKAADLGARDRA
jgi:enolase